MDTLTDKQKDNRAYHAKNAEKIREKKREQYDQAKASKPAPAKRTPLRIKTDPSKPNATYCVTKKEKEETKIRRRIEDILMERQLKNADCL